LPTRYDLQVRPPFEFFDHTGTDDPALRMKKYAPHLLKALDLESYEVVYGRHFLQEDSSAAITSSIARLISAR
jgi:hypothetical protein